MIGRSCAEAIVAALSEAASPERKVVRRIGLLVPFFVAYLDRAFFRIPDRLFLRR